MGGGEGSAGLSGGIAGDGGVGGMVGELGAERRRHEHIESLEQQLTANYETMLEQKDLLLEEAASEVEQLRGQLREAKGREEALKAALMLLGPS